MALSRKNYEVVAAIVKAAGPVTDREANGEFEIWFRQGNASSCHVVANNLADYFAADNPRFDRARFLKACGL